ncbi:MAG: hypothetical protein NXI01_01390 [Gammaproteobacteria bacterium]|nr:hypothetical protein [Gammaproteobacteria bacterium]
MKKQSEERAWIIQRCTDADHYENWLGHNESPMTRSEMFVALEGCVQQWPGDEFRGLNLHLDQVNSDRF